MNESNKIEVGWVVWVLGRVVEKIEMKAAKRDGRYQERDKETTEV
jgi:hypothetical protein